MPLDRSDNLFFGVARHQIRPRSHKSKRNLIFLVQMWGEITLANERPLQIVPPLIRIKIQP